MSPIHDPRFSKAQREKSRALDREESRRGGRTEYVKALAVTAVAVPVGFLLALRVLPGGFAAAAGGYLLWLVLSVAAAASIFVATLLPAG